MIPKTELEFRINHSLSILNIYQQSGWFNKLMDKIVGKPYFVLEAEELLRKYKNDRS